MRFRGLQRKGRPIISLIVPVPVTRGRATVVETSNTHFSPTPHPPPSPSFPGRPPSLTAGMQPAAQGADEQPLVRPAGAGPVWQHHQGRWDQGPGPRPRPRPADPPAPLRLRPAQQRPLRPPLRPHQDRLGAPAADSRPQPQPPVQQRFQGFFFFFLVVAPPCGWHACVLAALLCPWIFGCDFTTLAHPVSFLPICYGHLP